MMTGKNTPYYHAVHAALPSHLANDVRALCPSTSAETVLDSLIRFLVGADSSSDASSPEAHREWTQQQLVLKKALMALNPTTSSDGKRARDRDDDDQRENEHNSAPSDLPNIKRQRKATTNGVALGQDDGGGALLFSWGGLSATSPVRKKIDFAIHERSIRLTNPSSHALEAVIPLMNIHRVFIVPSRGKSKPHWTIMLLPSDIPDPVKSTTASAQVTLLVVFGVEATTTTLTNCTIGSTPLSLAKGTTTIHQLQKMLSFLPSQALPILRPTTEVFRSACLGGGSGSGSNGGVPGVEAYRGAKSGTLWFMKEGILWDVKSCEFWAVEDLLSADKGLRLLSATGRTCSIILMRKKGDAQAEVDDDVEEGIESEFGMVDGREQDGIRQWVRQYRHLFGKAKPIRTSNDVPACESQTTGAPQQVDDSDDDDEDYAIDSAESDGGSATSDSSDESNGDGSEENAEGSEMSDESEDGEEELDEKHHPLLRPGAMPRMSRAAIDDVVGMMEDSIRRVDDEEDDELGD